MKKVSALFLAFLLLAMAAVPASAVSTNPSVEAKSAPAVEGKAEYTDADGNTVEVDAVITAENAASGDTKVAMDAAYKSIQSANTIADLSADVSSVTKEPENYTVSDLFDVTVTKDGKDITADVSADHPLTVSFSGYSEDQQPIVLVACDGTTWKVAASSVSGTTLKVTFTEFCPVAIAVRKSAASPKTGDTVSAAGGIWLPAVLLIASVAALAVLFVVLKKRAVRK